MQSLGLASRDNFEKLYLRPALEAKLLEMTIPDKPQSRLQKYRLTEKGRELQTLLKQNNQGNEKDRHQSNLTVNGGNKTEQGT
jgi:hypothetical protein